MTSEFDFRNLGSGSQYSNTHGTQNNNSGPGNQFNANIINYNAQNQADSKLLADLRVTDPRNDKARIERRKGRLLRDSYRWILDHEAFVRWRTDTQSSLLWIRGDPGKGKTMLVCGIIDELPACMPGWGTIYFFCEAADSRLNNATAVLRSLLYLLLRKRPSLSRFIREEHEHAGRQLFEDTNGWDFLEGTFTNIVQDGGLNDFILIIDALDECTVGLDQLLDFIVRISLELNEKSISAAVNRYISHKVDQLASRKKYDINTRNFVYNRLSSKANDTFLWVALVTDQPGKPGVSERHARMKVEEFPQELDALYKRMLERTWESNDQDCCRRILAVVSIVCRPITLLESMSLAELEEFCNKTEILEEIVGECGSLLTVKDDIVYFVHQSAKDFLLRHALAETMPSGIHHEHNLLLSRSLEVMSTICRRNMYNIREPGASIDDICIPVPDPLEPAKYACVYWVEHIVGGGLQTGQCQFRQVFEFLKIHLLHWIETLSLLRNYSAGVISLFKFGCANQVPDEMLEQKLFVQDALRFIRHYRVAVENRPLQLYSLALIFSPVKSIIRKQFQSEVADWIIKRPVVDDEWSLCLQTLEGHVGEVHYLAISPDGTTLASASGDKTIKLWDLFTGQCLRTLQIHEDEVVSVVFSLKGDRLASASTSGIVKLWDKAAGRLLNTFHGNRSALGGVCVALYAGDQQIALGSPGTFEIWDIAPGQRVRQFQGPISSLPLGAAFSADGALFAFSMETGHIALFNTETWARLKTLDVRHLHNTTMRAFMAFSCNGTRLVPRYSCCGLTSWDLTTGQCIWADKGQSNDAPLACSRDGNLLAHTSDGGDGGDAVDIRDGETGKVLQRLSSTFTISALAFSVDGTQLIWGSEDRMIKIWDLTKLQRHQLDEPETLVADSPSTAMSPRKEALKGSSDTLPDKLSSSSPDTTTDCTTVDQDVDTIDPRFAYIKAVALSNDRKQLASISRDCFRLWDFITGQCLEKNDSASRSCYYIGPGASLTFSRDGIKFANSDDTYLTVRDAVTGLGLKSLEGHTDNITSTAFSNDGVTLASSSEDKTIKLWNSDTGECKMTFIVPEHSYFMRFSESGSQLITYTGTIILESLANTGAGMSTTQTPEITKSKPSDASDFILSPDDGGAWIYKNSKSILWIPPEYRASAFDAKGSAIAFGCPSGRVLMMEFSSDLSIL